MLLIQMFLTQTVLIQAFLILTLLAQMLGPDFARCKQAEERRSSGGGLYRGAAIGLFALHDADHGSNHHLRRARGFQSDDGRAAGSADVIHNDYAGSGAAETFDAAAGAVRFLCLAHQESMQQRRSRMRLRAPCAGCGQVRDNRIRSHRQSANSIGANSILVEKLEQGEAGETAAFGMERGGAAVDVVVACAAGRKLELPQPEAGAGEQGKQLGAVVRGGHQFEF